MRSVAAIVPLTSLFLTAALAAQGTETPFDRRMADPTVKGATQHIASAMIASGRDATREAARNVLGEWFWAFHADVDLSSEEREAEEIVFDESFAELAKAMREGNVSNLTIVGIEDVATPLCMRWHFLTVGPRGPTLVSAVVYNANGKPRLRDLGVETDLATIEAMLDAVDLPAGDKAMTIHLAPPPPVPVPPANPEEKPTTEP